MANQDPTLQTSGSLEAMLRLEWNSASINPSTGALVAMPVAFDSIQYGPANAPPPAWTPGLQYFSVALQVPGFGAMVPVGGHTSQAGYAGVALITDMSSNSVAAGKAYALTVDLGSYWIQLYFMVTGGPSGSTVLPGFGLWNLGTNPRAWTYVTPTQFTGEWEIGLLSPESDAPVWLSIEYAPPKDYGSGVTAKLVFTCRGGTITQNWNTPSTALPSPFPGSRRPVGTQYLNERSDPYVLRGKDGKKLGKA